MWGQFVEKQDKWIGGILNDGGDLFDKKLGFDPLTTKITSITLEPNGEDSAFFSVNGEKFSCGFDVRHGGISPGEEGWITFSEYCDHTWRIKDKA